MMDASISVDALRGVPETLLYPLYIRAVESQRPDPLLKDELAASLIASLAYDFSRYAGEKDVNRVFVLLRAREFDRAVSRFLEAQPDGVVIEIGCGLDTRFHRLDNGRVTWFDLDLPDVIAVRSRLLPEAPRRRMIARSMLDLDWLEAIGTPPGERVLIVAEGVFPYFEAAQVKTLVLALLGRFPGARLVFDIIPPFERWLSRATQVIQASGARVRWGAWRGNALEPWHPDLRLTREWHYLDVPEPRLGGLQTLFRLPGLRGLFKVVEYRLGG